MLAFLAIITIVKSNTNCGFFVAIKLKICPYQASIIFQKSILDLTNPKKTTLISGLPICQYLTFYCIDKLFHFGIDDVI